MTVRNSLDKLPHMKKMILLCGVMMLLLSVSKAQLLTWAPAFAKDNDNIVITMNAAKGNQGLLNYATPADVYVHVGVITNLSTSGADWKYVKFTWATTNAAAQAVSLGGNQWQYTISNIRTFFGVPAGETIQKICILFRNGAGTTVQRNADASDMYIPVYSTTLATRFTTPPFQPTYIPVPETINKSVGESISLTAVANATADNMKLSLNGNVVISTNSVSTISASPTIITSGNQVIVAEATVGATTKTDTLRFFVSLAPNIAPLPSGVRDGINYEAGNTSAVLVLYAPGKTRVSVIGEFPGSNWAEQSAYVMNKTPDGNTWWLRITGLTPGQEYAFQYLVDGTLKVGEPYAEKILDPSNDNFITAATYPGLRTYPAGQSGIVCLLQTNAPTYNWAVPTFNRPDKKNLVVYEMLLRDFLLAHDWNTFRDTLNYLKNMGVNAIEIMPLNEFDGNESWGYNPAYFLAPDKYYGPKNTLKEFIDSCHKKGIAVIMDIALNHTTGANPLAQLYWNSSLNQPAANNPWLNVTATHPFSVFNDFNHESLATRYFTTRVVEHWLQEYKVDGFRFDLSKGFTQTNSGTNVSLWGQYDASRVAIWKRYYDSCQLKAPGSYVILEHFADNSEEIELSNYGMLLWGNNTVNFQEAAMGFTANSNFEGFLHTQRGWTNAHLVGYMESHDEERMMYKNLQFGNTTNAAHNIQDLNTALKRIELCASFFLSAPGPKMIWQFGEQGYDFSINRCTDGTINTNCRLSNKPIRWDYLVVIQRKRLYDIYSALNKLRFHPYYKDAFIANNIQLDKSMSGGFKWMRVRTATDSSSLVVIGNFDVTAQSANVTFPVAGTWYDYLNGGTFTSTGAAQNITLQPGEYHVYLNRNLVNAVVTGVTGPASPYEGMHGQVYPNPLSASSVLEVNMPATGVLQADLINMQGQYISGIFSRNLVKGLHQVTLPAKLQQLPAGIYMIRLTAGNIIRSVKLVIP